MAKLNLIPEPDAAANGHHGEYIATAKLERAAALLMDLEDALDNATADSLMGHLTVLEETGQTLSVAEAREIFAKIYAQLCLIHVSITNERKTIAASKANLGG